jgi:hypothetical protein
VILLLPLSRPCNDLIFDEDEFLMTSMADISLVAVMLRFVICHICA